jgi:hypothetical protein
LSFSEEFAALSWPVSALAVSAFADLVVVAGEAAAIGADTNAAA